MALEETSTEKQEAEGLAARGRGKHDTHGHHPTQQTRGSWSEEQQHRRTPSVCPHSLSVSPHLQCVPGPCQPPEQNQSPASGGNSKPGHCLKSH